ncbi:MAG: nucleoside triphosphate pyrophosphohydrolase [Oscillospiraceae bacterium]|nr:nucleoside triphosphate pyrophosphohydrolase [Oscillospiraceae bacterium]
MNTKLILASNSPRRRELLKAAGFIFDIIPAKGEENIPPNTSPDEAVMILARQKADEVYAAHNDCIVIGADTIVAIDGDILGKPADSDEAFKMLKKLSDRKHIVYSGVAVCSKKGTDTFCERTEVEFYNLSDDEIRAYIETGEPFDKAGAYGIQDKGMMLVKSINGDFYNVMGLPVGQLGRRLSAICKKPPCSHKYGISDLLSVMARLRVECPWDKEQTHASIRANVIEEAYEVAEAIDNVSPEQLCEELGDLLLQVVFHGQIAAETGEYDFDDICDGICKKLIYRHPHVFGNVKADSTREVLKNWDDLKSASKGEQTTYERLLSVPKTLPALIRGEKVGKRAAGTGFDFASVKESLDSLKSEINELEEVIDKDLDNIHKKEGRIEEEFGDILFSCCNLGRFLKKDCEKALTLSINRFIMRFGRLEDMVSESGKAFDDFSATELDEMWNIVKENAH